MSIIKIRHFSVEDIPQIMAVQQAYQQVYPDASVISGEVYRSAGFEEGRNIFCALDENEVLQGYAPLFPNLTAGTQHPAYCLGGSKSRARGWQMPGRSKTC